MKRKFFIILLVLLTLMSGCTGKEPLPDDTLPETTKIDESETTTTLLDEYINGLTVLENPVREYGESTAYIQMDDKLGIRIAYPETGIDALDREILRWIEESVAYYEAETADLNTKYGTAELTADYDSCLFENLVSIKISGLFDKPYQAHPIDILKTFHADISTGELVSLDDLLLEDGKEKLKKMVMEDASLNEEDVDSHLLDNWVLNTEGLFIILNRGDYLPMSDGTVSLSYTHEELEDILVLPGSDLVIESENQTVADNTDITDITEKEVGGEADSIDPSKPMVALTFDDGPSKHTARLLDAFVTYGGKGTFFVLGNRIDERQDTIKRITQEGHEIGGHSWSHRQLTNLSEGDLTDQIMNTRAKIYEVTGVDATIIRPPYGAYNDDVKSVCRNLGIVMVNWSVDTLDWKHKDADKVYDAIMKDVKDGDIILCHDLYESTVDAMERVIPELLAQGYQLVTVSELLAYSDKEITVGKVYNKR